PQSGSWSRVKARLKFEECTPAKLQASKNIETGVEIEIAEIDVSALALLPLEVLVQKSEGWTGTDVHRPVLPACCNWQPVNCFKVQRDEVGYLSSGKLRVGSKKYVSVEDRPHLGMDAEHEELRIESRACSHPQPPTPGFAPDFALHLSDLWRNRRRLGCGSAALRRGGWFENCDATCKSTARFLTWCRDYSHARAGGDDLRFSSIAIENKQLVLISFGPHDQSVTV